MRCRLAAAGCIISHCRVIESIAPEVSTVQGTSKLAFACDGHFAGEIAVVEVSIITMSTALVALYMMAEHAALAISKIKFSFNAGCKRVGI
jgi:hypothetical protein